MDTHSATTAFDEEHSQVEMTDGSCKPEFVETVPVIGTTDADGCCSAEWVIGNVSAEVSQENLAAVKQEPYDVCCVVCHIHF